MQVNVPPPDLELTGAELYAEHTGNTEHLCAFDLVNSVTADDLPAELGALEPGEIGYIGRCTCGFSTRIRYSPEAAQSAVAAHVLAQSGASCLSELQRDVTR